jgi:hypothetical protein
MKVAPTSQNRNKLKLPRFPAVFRLCFMIKASIKASTDEGSVRVVAPLLPESLPKLLRQAQTTPLQA